MFKKILVVISIASLVAVYIAFDIGQYLNLAYFQQQKQYVADYQQGHGLQVMGLFFMAYVAVTGLSLPGAAVMSLMAGALFGLSVGVLLVSFASTLGATIAFLLSRWLLREWIQRRFGHQLATINKGMQKDGALYLLSLRLVPLFPFFVINLSLGLLR